jgi:hypothetical protein
MPTADDIGWAARAGRVGDQATAEVLEAARKAIDRCLSRP